MVEGVSGGATAKIASEIAKEAVKYKEKLSKEISKFEQIMIEKQDEVQQLGHPSSQQQMNVEHETVSKSNVVEPVDKTDTQVDVKKMLEDMNRGQMRLEELKKELLSGKKFTKEELLAIQAEVYSLTHELELASKVVDKSVSGLKEVMRTQV
jgi:flagellar hook-basal body complex protein FliE